MARHTIGERARAAIERFVAPSRTTCSCCRRPWWNERVAPHVTMIDEQNGVFTICERCWPHVPGAERFAMYEATFGERPDWPEIARAVELLEQLKLDLDLLDDA